MGTKDTSDFEKKNLYETMNKSFSGKTMVNVGGSINLDSTSHTEMVTFIPCWI